MRLFAVTLAFVALISCSPIDLKSAQRLAQTGTEAADATETALVQTQHGIDETTDLRELVKVFRPQDHRPVTKETQRELDRIRGALQARAAAMHELANVYQAFGALASYDASGEVSKALGDAVGSVNKWDEKIRELRNTPGDSLLSETLGKAIAAGGGLIADEALKAKVKDASERIRVILEGVTTVLNDEETVIVALNQRTAVIRTSTQISLWKAGVLEARNLFASRMQYGVLAFRVDDIYEWGSENPLLADRVKDELRRSFEQEAERIKEAYGTAIGAINDLVQEHLRLEEGEDVDLSLIRRKIDDLVEIAKPVFEKG
jgi:hypothetical protein